MTAIGIVLYGVVLPTTVSETIGPMQATPATTIGTVASSVLFVQAGLLLLLAWRLTGRRWAASTGVAAITYGAMVVPMTELSKLAGGDQAPTQHHLLAQSAVALVVVPLFGAGTLTGRRDGRQEPVRPLRLLAAVVAACLVLTLAVTVPVPSAGAARVTAIALGSLASAAWLLVAASHLGPRRGGGDSEPEVVWAAIVFVTLAAAGAADVGSVLRAAPYSLDGAALAILAGTLLAGAGGYQILVDLAANEDRALILRSLLDGVEEERSAREERAHDAQAALMAVRTAVTALRRYRERLDESARSQLELAVESELSLLADLVTATSAGRVTDRPVDVAGAIDVVAAVARNLGSQVTVDRPARGCWAAGRHNDLVRVLQTLLDNCRKHAPGSPVTIVARNHGGSLRITVADRGPGIPGGRKQTIFARGGRAVDAAVPGSGLGLFIASQLMAQQHGTIEVRDRLGGGAAFILTLRSARPGERGTPRQPLPARAARAARAASDRGAPAQLARGVPADRTGSSAATTTSRIRLATPPRVDH